MQQLAEFLQNVQSALWVAVAVAAIYLWRKHRTASAAWLGATFGILGYIVAVGRLTEWFGLTEGLAARVIGLVSIALITVFAYTLYRFATSFNAAKPLTDKLALGVTVAVVLTGFLMPEFQEGEAWTPVQTAWLFGLGLQWFWLLGYVGWRLFRAGKGQPTLARRRMRSMSVASVMLGLLLLIAIGAGAGNQGQEDYAVTVFTTSMGIASALLFLLAFATPRILRVSWRQPEELELNKSSLMLMGASTPREVTDILLPGMRKLVGAAAVAITDDDGTVIGSHGAGSKDVIAQLLADRAGESESGPLGPSTLMIDLAAGDILVWASRYAPFFGEEEFRLLKRLGLLADLAIDRTALLASERHHRNELEATNKELESFVYSASHDLKSPLIAMLGYIEVLSADYADSIGDEGKWYLQRMVTNGRYMESLIQDLLELSRVGRMQTEPQVVDTHDLVTGLGQEIQIQHPQVRVEVGDLPDLYVNPSRARQLIGNLLDNAVKYGGRDDVTIRVSYRELEEGDVEISVADDGEGIAPEYREKVFGVFERLNPEDGEQKGTGIGLAICRKICESIGGSIRIADSEEGADFRIAFPTTALADVAVPKTEAAQPAASPGTPDRTPPLEAIV